MPIALGRTLGVGQINTSGTTVVITTTEAATVGEWIIVRVAADNLSATTPTFTCADSAGNTYTVDRQAARNASAGAGIAGAVISAPVTTELPIGGTITVTLSGATFAKAAVAQAFTGVGGRRASGANDANGASTTPSVTLTTPEADDLVVGHIAHESMTVPSAYDTDTTNGSWSTGAFHPSATTGTDNQRVEVIYQHKIVNATGSQTYDATVVSADWLAFEVAYVPIVPVGKSLGLVWDVKAPVGKSVGLVWDVEFGVGVAPAFVLSLSANIAASGQNTTPQLTPPAGKTTGDFGGGRIQDDENPGDSLDLAADEYREDEWSIEATGDSVEETYQFRVLLNGEVLDVYAFTPEVTITAGVVAVGKDLGLVWDDRFALADPITVRWDQFTFLGDPIDLRWDLRFAQGDTATLRWDIFTRVSDQASLLWDIRAAVADTVALRWDLTQALGDPITLRWDQFIVGGDQTVLRWDQRFALGDPLALRWDQFTRIGDLVGLLWDQRFALGDTTTLRWDQFTRIGDPVSMLWDQVTRIGDQVGLLWDLRFALGDPITLRWDQFTRIGDQVALLWDLRFALGDPLTVRWDITTSYGEPIVFRWDQFTKAGDQAQFVWDTRALATDPLTLRWDVISETTVAKQATFLWDLRTSQGDSVVLRWDQVTRIGVPVTLRWDLRFALADPIGLVWDVAAAGGVGDVIALRWDITSALGDPLIIRWDQFIKGGDQVALRWDQRSLVSDSANLRWDVRAAVGDLNTLRWDDLVRLGDSVVLRWDVPTTTGDQTALRWDVRARVGDNANLVWDSLGAGATKTVTVLWDITDPVADQIDLLWGIYTKAGDAVVLFWDLIGPYGKPLVLLWDVEGRAFETFDASLWLERAFDAILSVQDLDRINLSMERAFSVTILFDQNSRSFRVGESIKIRARVSEAGTKKPTDPDAVLLFDLWKAGEDQGAFTPVNFTKVAKGDYFYLIGATSSSGMEPGVWNLIVHLVRGNEKAIETDQFNLQPVS